MKLKKVYPIERISIKNVGVPTAAVRLHGPKYYKCPHCHSKTLIRYQEVSPFATQKTPPDFDTDTLRCLEKMGKTKKFSSKEVRTLNTYDFFCRSCNSPVRLLYDEQEQGMGGFMRAVVHHIIEVI